MIIETYIKTVLNNLIEVLNFHSNQYSLIKQSEYFSINKIEN